jgi:hypothetical protein
MDSSLIPEGLVIPPRDEEVPVRTFNGFVFANDAWHCRPIHLWPKGVDELEKHPDWKDQIERYLAAFCEPVTTAAKEICCVACNEQVTGAYINVEDWRHKGKLEFSQEGTWEGRCRSCGYPCRLKHEIMLGELLLVRLQAFPLFYHPSATQRTN